MSYELIIGIVGFVGVALSWAAFRHFFTRGRSKMRASGEAVIGLVFVSVAVLGASIAFNLRTYDRLTKKTEVGEVLLTKVDKQHYRANLAISGRPKKVYDIYGDEVRIEARILKWTPRATIFGLDTQYALDRIEGRYQNTDEQNNSRRMAYSLVTEHGTNIFAVARKNAKWVPFVDAQYGDGPFVPMADQARYRIVITAGSLVLEAVNEAAKEATNDWK